MDVLASGTERAPSRAAALLRRLPPAPVAALLAAVLTAGVLAVGPVESALRERDDVSGVQVRLVVERATRAGDGSAYGFARLQVADPAGRAVRLLAVEVQVPGVRLGPAGADVGDLRPGPSVALRLRFAVPDCAELVLPGALRARVSRPDGPGATLTAPLDRAAVQTLRGLCGLAPGG